jgi:hypothetical protein
VEVLKSWHEFLHPTRRIRSSRRRRHPQQGQHAAPTPGGSYAIVEPVERRTLFSLNVAAQAFSPGVPQLVFTDIATGNTNGSGATGAQSVTIINTGAAAVSINSASIIDDSSVSGDDAAQFQSAGFASGSIAPGASATFSVKFQASSVGVHSAILRVESTDPNQPTVDVALRGIGTASDSSGEVGGDKEPSLQRILNAFQIPVNAGDADGESTTSFPTPRPAGTANDEVSMPRLVKSGSGPVIVQALAAYQFNNKVGPATHFGFYMPGTPDVKTELFQIALGSQTSTSPGNAASFDPGSTPFSLYDTFNGALFESNGLPRTAYSEDLFNTWASNVKQKFRFFPLKNKDGSVVPNAFVFTTEDFDGTGASSFDNNDLVGIIRNVKAAPAGPEIGSAAVDRGMLPTQLAFNRVQEQPPTTIDPDTGEEIPLPNNVVHDKAKVRIYNSGTSPLTISSVVLSNTTDFKINTTGLSGKTIAPGSSLDIEVQFIATAGRVKTGTMTVNTDDADEGAYVVKLAGYWQQKSEHDREPTLQEVVQLAGFSTVAVGEGQMLADGGKVAAVGDEVLSPYWRAADPAESIEVVQLGAWHTHDQTESFKWFYKGAASPTTLFTHDALSAQSFLPFLNGSTTNIAAGTFKVSKQGSDSNPAFGFKIQNESSDDTKNVQEQPGGGFGHHVRFYPAKDASGKFIPNTYIMGMDYLAINYDYEDNVYLIRNIRPADATTAPAAPAGLAATGSDEGVALNWADNTDSNLAGYNVYRGTSADFTPGAGNRLNGSPLTSSEFSDATAPVGVASFYKVTAVGTSGAESSPSASASATRTGQVQNPPGTPAGFAVSGVTSSSVTLVWNAVTGVSKYVLQRRPQGGSTFTTVSDAITTTTFTDTGLSASTNYEYQLAAVDSAGMSSAPTAALAVSTSASSSAPPAISATDPRLAEPQNGTADMTFTVSLSAAANQAISLNYATADGSALAGSDFTASSGSITFAPGETTKTIIVPIKADAADEPAETFTLNFTLTGGNATLSDQAAQGTILPATSAPTPTPTTPTPTPTGTPIPFGGKIVANVLGHKIALKGPGSGTATVLDGNVIQIDVTGSTSASALAVNGKGTVQLADVTVNGSLKSFTGKTADLTGNFKLTGTLGKLTAHDTHNSRTLTVAGSGVPVSLALANASDLSVNSASPIKSIKAAAWLDTDNAADTITAPALSSLSVKGNMAADVVAGLLGKVSVGGSIQGATIRSDGDISSIRAGAMHDSAVYAGVRSDLTGMPSAAADFTKDALIKSFSVRGKAPGSFSNTVIAAQDLGKISLGSVMTANNGTPFGVAADRIAAVRSTLGSGKVSLKRLDAPADSQTQDDFTLRLI